jgi:hypothetical protein
MNAFFVKSVVAIQGIKDTKHRVVYEALRAKADNLLFLEEDDIYFFTDVLKKCISKTNELMPCPELYSVTANWSTFAKSPRVFLINIMPEEKNNPSCPLITISIIEILKCFSRKIKEATV